jgi:hypothetical protein
MNKYIIERTLPGAGKMTDDEWGGAANTSNDTIGGLGDRIKWLHSYVTADKVYCVYEATDPEVIREHGRRGGFPVDRVEEVVRVIDPSTANATV